MVQTGVADVVIAGGAKHEYVEYYTTNMRQGQRRRRDLSRSPGARQSRSQPAAKIWPISGMIETAENLATEYQISRDEADAFAAARKRVQRPPGRKQVRRPFSGNRYPATQGWAHAICRGRGVRGDTTLESLSKLRSITGDGVVTAGSSTTK